jgi:hypothetical protein
MKDLPYFLKRNPKTPIEYLNIYSLMLSTCDLIGFRDDWILGDYSSVNPEDILQKFVNNKCIIGIFAKSVGNLKKVYELLKKYKCRYILIIAQDVFSATHFLKHDPEILGIIDKVYFKNLDVLNPKCFGVPLGCGFWVNSYIEINLMRENCKNKTKLMNDINSSSIVRKNKIFNDYTTTTDSKSWRVGNFNTRLECLDFMKKNKDTFKKGGIEIDIVEKRITQKESWKKYRESKFVLSPPGNGYDCHRHFEAIILGAIPIFIRTPFMISTVYVGFPYIELNSIQELTPELLNSYDYKKFNREMLETKYWRDKIRSS